jgi:putative hydrolase of the HAD superfamily
LQDVSHNNKSVFRAAAIVRFPFKDARVIEASSRNALDSEGSSLENVKYRTMQMNLESTHDVNAVLFDYGEVLCHPPTDEENAKLAAFFNLDLPRLRRLWERNRGAFDRGDFTSQVYWSMLAKDAGITVTAAEIEKICELDMTMWSMVNSSMVDWAHQLRASGLKIGLLSNMHPDMVSHCRKQFAWLNSFDFVTFSGEVRMIKPDPAIYEHTLRGLGTCAAETLFLDDREQNVRAAQDLGIRAIRFKSVVQLRNDLEAVGFPILPELSS